MGAPQAQKPRARVQPTPVPWTLLLCVFVALVAVAPWVWRQLTGGSGPSPAIVQRLHTSLAHIESTLRECSRIRAPAHSEDDRHSLHVVLRSLELSLPAVLALRAKAHLPAEHEAEQRFQALPLLALNVASLQRARIAKVLLEPSGASMLAHARGDAQSRGGSAQLPPLAHVLPEDVDAFGASFLLSPLQLLLDTNEFPVLRPHPLPQHSSIQRSLIEYAAQKGFRAGVESLLPRAKTQCDEATLTVLRARVAAGQPSALRLAQLNEDEPMEQLLRKDANACLMLGVASNNTANATRASHAERTEDADSLVAPDGWGSGGWRPPPILSPSQAAMDFLPARGCPFPRVPLSELTTESFATLYARNTPLFVTGVVEQWRARNMLTRDKLQNMSAEVEPGVIPYGLKQQGSSKAQAIVQGNIPLSKFVAQMDDAFEAAEDQDDDAAEPAYVFDVRTLHTLRWAEGEADAIFTLPAVLTHTLAPGVVNVTAPGTRQSFFYIGPAESAAPWHFHCPAANGLVYGAKRWWFQPPSRALYTQTHPVPWMEEPTVELPAPYSCIQRAGDLLVIPPRWSHAVLNLQESVGIAVEFNTREGECDWGTA